MKKFYLFFLLCFIAFLGSGQDTSPTVGSSVGYDPSMVVSTKSAKPKVVQNKNLDVTCQISAAIVAAPGSETWNNDVQAKLLATGRFTTVDVFFYVNGVPTLTQIEGYDAILAYTDYSIYTTEVGNLLAEYIDNGGAVVTAVFSTASIPYGGAFASSGYQLILPSGQISGIQSMGTVYDALHLVMENVNSFNGGSSSYRSSAATVASGCEVLADWTDGQPLVVIKENVGPASVRRVDLNFFPPSVDARGDFWDSSTDGDILLANALVWVSQKCDQSCISDIEQDNDPGECGAIVTYTQPMAWDTAVSVLQIDTSGFTSGDMFPVDTTVLSYRIEYPSGNVDTCTFNVIVKDAEAPVISCNSDMVVPVDAGGTSAQVNYPAPTVLDNCSADVIVNGSFETGDYTGWTLWCSDPYYGTFGILQADQTLNYGESILDYFSNNSKSQSSPGLPITAAPTDGNYMGILLETNSTTHRMYQDVDLPLGARDLSIDLQYQSHTDLNETSQYFAVYVRDVNTDAVLETLFKTMPGDPTFIPMTTLTFDVSAYAGQTVRLDMVFAQVQNYYFDVLFDNIHLNTYNLEQTAGLPSGSDFPVGTTTNSFKVTDEAGNVDSCSFDITVDGTLQDTIAPVAKCKDITIQIGGAYIIHNPYVLDNGSYDNEGTIASLSVDKDTFSCGDVGVNIVTLTVTDNSGNQATCESEVTVIDVNTPVFQSIDDLEIQLEAGKCDTAITYPELIVDDNCEVTLTLLEGIGPDGGAFPIGTSVETWEAKDLSGNADTVSFSVTVSAASTVPVIDAIDDLTLDNDEEVVEVALEGISDSGCTIDNLMVTASTTDDSIINSLEVSYVNLSTSGLLTIGLEKGVLGSATVTVRVENNEGGVTEVDFAVNVTEINDAPTLLIPEDDYTVNAAHELKVLLSPVSGDYFDDVDDAVLTLSVYEEGTDSLPGWATMSGDTLICTPLLPDTGCVTIVVEASDAAGATAMDTFTICVDGYVLGLNDIMEDSNISMYPNPTSGKVVLTFKNVNLGDTEIKVYTMSGQEVFRKEYRYDNEIQLDLSDQVSGIYLVRIIQGSLIETRKLILDRK